MSNSNFYTGSLHLEGKAHFHKQTQLPTSEADHAVIFAEEDESLVTRLYAMDSGGNITQISPHNDDGDWVFVSTNVRSGKLVRINMTKMIRKLEEITGESFIEESS